MAGGSCRSTPYVTILEHLAVICGQPLLISSDRGIHFTGQEVQAWACTNNVGGQLLVPIAHRQLEW